MFKVFIYEEGKAYEYYTDEYCTGGIYLMIKNYEDLIKIIDIALNSGHSIEIIKITDKEMKFTDKKMN